MGKILKKKEETKLPAKGKGEPKALARRPQDIFTELHRQMNQLFQNFIDEMEMPSLFGRMDKELMVRPKFDVVESAKAIEITGELPGLDEKDVEILLDENILTVSGEKKHEEERKDKNCHLLERSFGSFQRSFALPSGIVPDKITAEFKKGVLKITIPKTGEAPKEAKKIHITTG